MKKQGAIGEGILMIYRLLLVSFIAFIILGISSVFYVHYIDVRDVEAKVLTREVVECISPNGVLNLSSLSEEDRKNILIYCGFDANEIERFYVEVEINDSSGDILKLRQGDSGALWVLGIFKNEILDEGIKKYEPGYYESNYSVNIMLDEIKLPGSINTKVLVKDEL